MNELIRKFGSKTSLYYKKDSIVGCNTKEDNTDDNARMILDGLSNNLKLEQPVALDKATYNPGERNVGIGKGVNLEHKKSIQQCKTYSEYFATPSKGKGESKQEEKKMVHCMKYIGTIDKVKIVDYEIPLCNRGTALGKGAIDLAFEYDGEFYIVETKKIESKESLLRCVLEIETYYETLNKNFDKYSNKVKKGILVDKSSLPYLHYFDGNHKNVVDLMKYYGIDLFELSYVDNEFHIKKVNECPTSQEN